jgi:RNA 2',3'-cyclic 3'-phosphodiesterase
MELFRGFIAVEVPVTEQILNFQGEIKKTDANVKLVEPENIHITLKFLGETSLSQINAIESIMKQVVSSVKKHEITLAGTGAFPNINYIKVIWIGIQESNLLSEMANLLNQQGTKLGLKKEKKTFSAHLTIGRMKSSKGKDQIVTILQNYEDVEFAKIPVTHLHLKKSTLTPKGPIYETLSSIPLP